MMKKAIVPIFVLAVILIVVAGGVFFYLQQRAPLAVELVLPPKPLIYVRAVDMEKKWAAFKATQFWQTISDIDYVRVMKEVGVNEKTLALHRDMREKLSAPEVQKFLELFLGKEAVFAFYSGTGKESPAATAKKLDYSAVLITRLKPELRLADSLAKMAAKMNKDISVQEVEYLKNKITIISMANSPAKVAYTRIKNLLVIGLGEDVVKKCLTVYMEQKPSLGKDPAYLAAKTQSLPQAAVEGYVNAQLFFSYAQDQFLKVPAAKKGGAGKEAPEETPEEKALREKQVAEQMKQFSGFNMVSFSAVLNGASQLKASLHYDRNAIPADLQSFYDCRAEENKTLVFVPSNVLGYQWSTCNDFNYYWQQISKDTRETLAKESADGTLPVDSESPAVDPGTYIEKLLGKSIEKDVLPLLGQEVGGYLRDVDYSGTIPLPSFLVFLKVTNQSKAESLLSGLTKRQSALREQKEEYNGTQITYFSLPVLKNIEPAFCFYDDYLLVSLTRQTLKDSLDLSKDPTKSLRGNPTLQKLDPLALTGKTTSFFYLDTPFIANKLDGLLDWGQKWLGQQIAKQEAFKTGSEKRLGDVKKAITENEQTIKTINEEIVKLEADKTAIQEKPQELTRVGAEIERVEKFIASLEKSVEPQLVEEKELLTVKNDPNLALPPEGETQLKAVQDAIKKKQSKIQSLKEEMNALEEQKKLLTTVESRRTEVQLSIDTKKEKIGKLESEIASQKDNQAELEKFIKTYEEHQPLSERQRDLLVNQFFRPLIKATGKIRGLASRVNVETGVVTFTSSWSLE